ncbi:putative short-chain dehydrogenase/reductase [Drepanopeziza brunnea f. sp. 'multigermtubi' MB_m1]|uniref:Putative short-chain dehydrogenase/reductase n=1 Tax=Marssonina brunnea f. sp. multigermtubi (strain MB_m1) TaxID=1072389 RepID=K1WLV6_MARBU|nr:putative short-chain dehydrogenase/reductase [Drepanopeziza brunnea f. sp. 'multigermtubi' MB_m1]EKD18665.1 putative short-chain dehydrogenase/reductase [Drepanopeziza brunnea f. sp. 'multigermtubi' MB_m1]
MFEPFPRGIAASLRATPPQIWLIVGATRGIGLEFTTQLLDLGYTVIATARAPTASTTSTASNLWALTGTRNGHNLTILECDVSSEDCIKGFTEQVRRLGRPGGVLDRGVIDVAVLNAGILEYPGRVSEVPRTPSPPSPTTSTPTRSGPSSPPPTSSRSPPRPPRAPSPSPAAPSPQPTPPTAPIHVKTLVFLSSDSGSAARFRAFEDGFGVYSASKAALNQGLRHLAAELHKKSTDSVRAKSASPLSISNLITGSPGPRGSRTVVLALHPGEVSTEMAADVGLAWEVEGIISPRESVGCMLRVIAEKGWGGYDEGGERSAREDGKREEEGAATFWTWEGRRHPW